jgi:outer membrane protein OmpA-like peptidoglycan-associated protein
MRRLRILASLVIISPLIVTAGCGFGGNSMPPPAPYVPVVPAYLQADVIGGHAARLKKARAAGLKALNPAGIPDYVSREEIDLRRETAGTGVDVIRSGNLLLLRLPASGTFDVGKSMIKPQAVSTLTEIALTLKKFNQSFVDVLGHTDSTGTEASNKVLSERRAQAVAAHLRSRGVGQSRIATRGYGATEPIGDNSTDIGRAMNRRVEIKIVPLR